jgi:predicted ArsR family transcriptional regulator
MSRTAQILQVISDGPATASEVAAELSLRFRKDGVCALLNKLERQGKIKRSNYRVMRSVGERGKKIVNLWSRT